MPEFVHNLLVEELTKAVESRADTHRHDMAKGLSVDAYRELVGKHKECRHLLDLIAEVAKKFEAHVDE